MNISAINVSSRNVAKPAFGANTQYYENPINRGAEKKLAIWTTAGGCIAGGLAAAGLASCFVEGGFKANKKLLSIIGGVVALGAMALTLPSKIYNTKVNAFAREKEMDVFARDRALKSSIMEEVNKEVKDDEVPLDKKVSHFATVQMAQNGRGLMVKGA